ncbi:MAG: hypothetical protein AMXMBFR16_12890 [Candidatus Uhrbacteria bacterium]
MRPNASSNKKTQAIDDAILAILAFRVIQCGVLERMMCKFKEIVFHRTQPSCLDATPKDVQPPLPGIEILLQTPDCPF